MIPYREEASTGTWENLHENFFSGITISITIEL
jgi:hypothetical protein